MIRALTNFQIEILLELRLFKVLHIDLMEVLCLR